MPISCWPVPLVLATLPTGGDTLDAPLRQQPQPRKTAFLGQRQERGAARTDQQAPLTRICDALQMFPAIAKPPPDGAGINNGLLGSIAANWQPGTPCPGSEGCKTARLDHDSIAAPCLQSAGLAAGGQPAVCGGGKRLATLFLCVLLRKGVLSRQASTCMQHRRPRSRWTASCVQQAPDGGSSSRTSGTPASSSGASLRRRVPVHGFVQCTQLVPCCRERRSRVAGPCREGSLWWSSRLACRFHTWPLECMHLIRPGICDRHCARY